MKKGITFALLLLAIGAEACLCVPRTPKEDYDAADTVFVGKVTALTGKKDERWPIMTASMEVERSWKGLHGIRTQVRDTATDCQVGFKVGVRYLVYVRDGRTEGCFGTKQVDDSVADEIKALGPSLPLK